MRLRFFVSSVLLIAIACKSEDKRKNADLSGVYAVDSISYQQNSLYQEVMLIHDSAMILMSDVSSLTRRIKNKRDLTEEFDTEDEIQKASQELEAANESMMDWMRNFDPDLETLSHEETMKYLEREKEKIEEIKKKMGSAVKNAEDLLR